MHTANALVLGLLGSLALASRPLSSNELASKGTTPALPLGLWKEAKRRRRHDDGARGPWKESQTGQLPFLSRPKPSASCQEHYFDQLVSHDPHIPSTTPNETWQQRYWFDATFYKPGGPVFLLDAGETDGEGRLPFLSQGILRILSEATNGIGIVFEHRYYGKSFPVSDLTTDSLRFLTTRQSLDDGAHFARNIVLPGLEDIDIRAGGSTPWIYYGGSYAGAKAALARKLYPDVFAGGIASSAVTAAIEDYWQYYEPIRQNGPSDCIDRLVNHTSLIDSLLAFEQPALTSALKGYFGLGNVTSDADFVNALAIPLGSWQARNWDPSVGSTRFFEFCDTLTANSSSVHEVDLFQPAQLAALPSLPKDPRKALASFAAYVSYVREHVATLCPPDTAQDDCFGTDEYSGDELDDYEWKSWAYQFCTEWGYFIGAPPDSKHPSLVSRLLTTEYTGKICRKAFPPGDLNSVPARPNVTAINQYGGFNFSYPRLAFVDGSEDPWIYATPHSPLAPHHGHRHSTTSEPFLLIKGGVHHWDENGRPSPPEPEEIQRVHREDVEFVRAWLEEWREEQREKERKRRGRWRWEGEGRERSRARERERERKREVKEVRAATTSLTVDKTPSTVDKLPVAASASKAAPIVPSTRDTFAVPALPSRPSSRLSSAGPRPRPIHPPPPPPYIPPTNDAQRPTTRDSTVADKPPSAPATAPPLAAKASPSEPRLPAPSKSTSASTARSHAPSAASPRPKDSKEPQLFLPPPRTPTPQSLHGKSAVKLPKLPAAAPKPNALKRSLSLSPPPEGAKYRTPKAFVAAKEKGKEKASRAAAGGKERKVERKAERKELKEAKEAKKAKGAKEAKEAKRRKVDHAPQGSTSTHAPAASTSTPASAASTSAAPPATLDVVPDSDEERRIKEPLFRPPSTSSATSSSLSQLPSFRNLTPAERSEREEEQRRVAQAQQLLMEEQAKRLGEEERRREAERAEAAKRLAYSGRRVSAPLPSTQQQHQEEQEQHDAQEEQQQEGQQQEVPEQDEQAQAQAWAWWAQRREQEEASGSASTTSAAAAAGPSSARGAFDAPPPTAPRAMRKERGVRGPRRHREREREREEEEERDFREQGRGGGRRTFHSTNSFTVLSTYYGPSSRSRRSRSPHSRSPPRRASTSASSRPRSRSPPRRGSTGWLLQHARAPSPPRPPSHFPWPPPAHLPPRPK
ncbi:hypothetical protein NBRC10513v2_005515 [Rhodotorula toruloides]